MAEEEAENSQTIENMTAQSVDAMERTRSADEASESHSDPGRLVDSGHGLRALPPSAPKSEKNEESSDEFKKPHIPSLLELASADQYQSATGAQPAPDRANCDFRPESPKSPGKTAVHEDAGARSTL